MTQDVRGWAASGWTNHTPPALALAECPHVARTAANCVRDYDGVTTTAWVIGAA